MQVKLAQPRSFCAGVVRAIHIVETALEIYGSPVYVLHEIVHNRHVVEDLQNRGAIFVEDLNDVPDGEKIIFSAHGVAKKRVDDAIRRNLEIIDATCPLVTKVHREVAYHARQASEVILIGHAGHVEVNGTMGQYDRSNGGDIYLVQNEEEVEELEIKDPDNLSYVTQTTLSFYDTRKIIEALKRKFPNIEGPKKDDICYATQNRQNAVMQLADEIDILLVVGAKNSSNSNRLKEVGEKRGIESYLIQDASDIIENWFYQDCRIGVTAGASTPEVLVQGVLKKLTELGVSSIAEMDAEPEKVIFPLPSALREAVNANTKPGH